MRILSRLPERRGTAPLPSGPLARTRELSAAGAERGVALSLALRDAGRPSAALALAAGGLAAALSPSASLIAAPLAALLGLALVPLLTRSLGSHAFPRPEPLRAEVSPTVGSLRRRGTDARRS